MKSLFYKNKKEKEKSYKNGFFDYEEDIDPWDGSPISFFKGSNQKPKKEPEKQHLDEDDFAEIDRISFPNLDSSYQPKKTDEHYEEQPAYSSTQKNEQPAYTPPRKNEQPTFFNIEEESFEENKIDRINLEQRLIDVERMLAEQREAQRNIRIDDKANTLRIDENFDDRKNTNFNRDADYDRAAGYNKNADYVRGSEYNRNKDNREEYDEEPKSNPYLRKSKIFIFIAFVSVCIIFFLYLIDKTDSTIDGDVPFIEAPKTIKQRPVKPNKPLVPYQDELIYGKLDDQDKDSMDDEENIMPQTDFAPNLSFDEEPDIIEGDYPNYDEGIEGEEDEDYDESSYYKTKIDAKVIDARENKKIVKSERFETKAKESEAHDYEESDYLENIGRLKTKNTNTKKEPVVEQTKKSNIEIVHNQRKLNVKGKEAKKEVKKVDNKKTIEAKKTSYYILLSTVNSKDLARKEIVRLKRAHKPLTNLTINVKVKKNVYGQTIFDILAGPINDKARAERIKNSLGKSRFKVVG